MMDESEIMNDEQKNGKVLSTCTEENQVVLPDNPLWQVERPTGPQQNMYLFERNLYSDCVFIAGEGRFTKKFQVHKLILAKASPVFAAMLFGPLADEEITIKGIEPEVFQAMLEYVYTEDIASAQFHHLIVQLCQAADMYYLPGLMKFCVQHLNNTLTIDTACYAFYVGDQLKQEKLKQRAWKIITRRTSKVLATEEFQNSPRSTVLAISAQEELNVDSEAQLINKCFEWAENEVLRQELSNSTANLKKVLGPILNQLRFLCLTLDELAQGPAKSNVLTDKEKVAIQIKIACPDDPKVTIPFGFSDENKSRMKISLATPVFAFTKDISVVNSHPSYNRGSFASFCFEVDNDILLLGIVVPCNTENWEILVLDINGKQHFDGKVAKTEVTTMGNQILFEKPIDVPHNNSFKIILTNATAHHVTVVIGNVTGKNIADPCIAANPNQSVLNGLIYAN